jgi:NAD(P)-dependent dehydrogenase (short-subunit alcohol dehydrogenase family)
MGLARMQGKSVVISGAAFGIGPAAAAKFAEEGASLLVQDNQERPLLAFVTSTNVMALRSRPLSGMSPRSRTARQ